MLKKIPKPRVIRKPKKVPISKGGYNVYGRSRGVFRKLNLVPLKKSKAKNLGSFLVDFSTSRSFKTQQIPFKAKKPRLKVPIGYYKKYRIKFRGRKVRGKIMPIKKIHIEKSKYAIDTKGEVKGLSIARARAKLLKKYNLKKVKKRPTRKILIRKSKRTKLKSVSLITLKKRK